MNLEPEFVGFGKIQHVGKLYMSITQKIHGTNAQIYIYEDTEVGVQIKAGSRTRWLTPDDDNFGFAKFVHDNSQELIQKLGYGRHFGEWAGPGINAGEGLTEKSLFLFNWRRWKEMPLPAQLGVVPVLHTGKLDINEIDFVMAKLKQDGSYICPGYMKPEGIVIEVGGEFYKKVFDAEEIAWKAVDKKPMLVIEGMNITHLLQPLRLEKLLSRDERYMREYPRTLPEIISAYVKDLQDEQQITGTEEEISAIKKALGKRVFSFVKDFIRNKEKE